MKDKKFLVLKFSIRTGKKGGELVNIFENFINIFEHPPPVLILLNYSSGAPVNISSLALITEVSPCINASILPKNLGNSDPI